MLNPHRKQFTKTIIIYCCCCCLYICTANAKNYFVSTNGNNSNDGLSVLAAFKTIQKAADKTIAGDTVFVMNGVYTNTNTASNVVDIFNSGSSIKWIVYQNFPGHQPVIQLGGNNWAGIQVQGADYILVEGFSVIGNNDAVTLAYASAQKNNLNNPTTSGNGIGCAPEYNNAVNKTHHLTIRGCTITNCGGGGIYSNKADYLRFENNTVSKCGWYAPYGNSGISLYQNWNSDSSVGIKNYVVGNTCFRNENFIPFFFAGSITDGNGIILDDCRNTQNNSTLGRYLGTTYVANNLVFDNGGRGIHCYESDHVIVINNTCYFNCQSPAVKDGELTAFDAGDISFINNIAFPSGNTPPVNRAINNTTNILVSHNLWGANAAFANPLGTNTVVGSPAFVLPTINPVKANFHLQNTSAAINKATRVLAPVGDKDHQHRKLTNSVDIGCYEYQSTTPGVIIPQNNLIIFPNPIRNQLYFQMADITINQLEIVVVNSFGQVVLQVKSSGINGFFFLDVSKLSNQVYFFIVVDLTKKKWVSKFIKLT